jgi:hypothetical protein
MLFAEIDGHLCKEGRWTFQREGEGERLPAEELGVHTSARTVVLLVSSCHKGICFCFKAVEGVRTHVAGCDHANIAFDGVSLQDILQV